MLKIEKIDQNLIKVLPEELQKKVIQYEKQIIDFSNWLIKEYKEELIGINIIPKEFSILENEEDRKSDKIHLFILLDDKKTDDAAKLKIDAIQKCVSYCKDKELKPEIMLLGELWQNCYDGNFEILKIFSLGYNIADKGLVGALRMSEIHKIMVLEKFEKYIVAYVIAGSVVRGEATPTSDVDAFVVVDDTDVKRMSRVELREKLRAIIIESSIIAKQRTQSQNEPNIQVYLLTEFWDSLRQANPVIYTFLRDGIPLYDRGIFMPWKHLLKMGMIHPSPEAVERLFDTGERILEDLRNKIKEMIIEDLYYAVLTPSQAALMKYGISIPPPKGTPSVFRSVFIEKEKMIEEKYVKILEDAIKIRKDVEHGIVKDLNPEELIKYYKNAQEYLKRIKKLFDEIDEKKDKEIIIKMYDDAITIIRDALKMEGIEKVGENEIRTLFEEHIIKKGKLPQNILRKLDEILEGYQNYINNQLDKLDMNKLRQTATEFIKSMIEFLQKESFKKMEEFKVRLKGKEKIYELLSSEENIYLIDSGAEKIYELDKQFNLISTITAEEFIEKQEKQKLKRTTLNKNNLEKIEKLLNDNLEIIM
ncbi:MAG: nucleotidyltransferase domain-containing protein [Candidatus Woesearchaeota archaeon]